MGCCCRPSPSGSALGILELPADDHLLGWAIELNNLRLKYPLMDAIGSDAGSFKVFTNLIRLLPGNCPPQ